MIPEGCDTAGGATLAIDVQAEDRAVGYAIRGGEDPVVGGLAPHERSRLVLAVEGGPREIAIDATSPLVVEGFMLT